MMAPFADGPAQIGRIIVLKRTLWHADWHLAMREHEYLNIRISENLKIRKYCRIRLEVNQKYFHSDCMSLCLCHAANINFNCAAKENRYADAITNYLA